VTYVDLVRTPTKAGFNARLSLDPASPNIGCYADPMLPGRNFFEGGSRPEYNVATVSWATSCHATIQCVAAISARGQHVHAVFEHQRCELVFDGQISSTPTGCRGRDDLRWLAHNCNVERTRCNKLRRPSRMDLEISAVSGAVIAINSGRRTSR